MIPWLRWFRFISRILGGGIPSDVASRLFDPFYTTKQKGTGLGLAISQQIIEEHGGTIEVDVAETQGAMFVVTLPGLNKFNEYKYGKKKHVG